MAEMLHAIDEYDELNYHHHRRIVFVDSFLLDIALPVLHVHN